MFENFQGGQSSILRIFFHTLAHWDKIKNKLQVIFCEFEIGRN